jgi:type IV pilus assembly protein PilA
MIMKKQNGFTLMELMIVIAIIGILSAIAVPNFISYRNTTYCTRAEADANAVALALAEFFANPSHIALPTIEQLNVTFSEPAPRNTAELGTTGLNDTITIRVTDQSGLCPDDYQNGKAEWTGGVYTKTITN